MKGRETLHKHMREQIPKPDRCPSATGRPIKDLVVDKGESEK